MTTEPTAKPVEETGHRAGRGLAALGGLTALLALVLYGVQLFYYRALNVTPWYIPILCTAAALLVLLALFQGRTFSRWVSLLCLVALAGVMWYALVVFSLLPTYTGPVAQGQPFPAFTTTLADGTPYTQEDLKGDKDTLMVFFRGRW